MAEEELLKHKLAWVKDYHAFVTEQGPGVSPLPSEMDEMTIEELEALEKDLRRFDPTYNSVTHPDDVYVCDMKGCRTVMPETPFGSFPDLAFKKFPGSEWKADARSRGGGGSGFGGLFEAVAMTVMEHEKDKEDIEAEFRRTKSPS